MKKILLLTSLMTVLAFASAQIIHVPGDQPTIQAGIDAANFWGDTVLVDDGTYYENINFSGKFITVASNFIIDGDTNHINNTIIDGSQPSNPDKGSVVTFMNYEDTTSVLCGFTITGGTGTHIPTPELWGGGGITIENAGAKIIYNHIEYNTLSANIPVSGGGIGAGDAYNNLNYVVIKNNRISNNSAESYKSAEGGGMAIFCNAIIMNNIVTQNTVDSETETAVGGGIRVLGYESERHIECSGNTISLNEVYSSSQAEYAGAGGLQVYRCYGNVSNNKISENISEGSLGSIGGGVLLAHCNSELLFENNVLNLNYSNYGLTGGLGGAIYAGIANPKMINNIITNNYASSGGGLYNHSNQDGPTQIINNTFAFNVAYDNGAALYLKDADAVVLNTIMWDEDEEIYLDGANIEVAYSDIFGSWSGEGNIMDDPEFMDDLYHIGEESPCRDAGIDELTMMGILVVAPDFDFEGTPRPMFAGIDIGADEYPPTVGIDEYEANIFNMRVYPNPTSGRIHLNYNLPYSGDLIFNILNTHGKLLQSIKPTHQSEGENTVDLDLAGFPNGLYFVQIIVGQRVETTKIIIQK